MSSWDRKVRRNRALRVETVAGGKLNAYLCPECGQYTVTVDVDSGTTPSNLGCRAQGFQEGDRSARKCTGMAASLFYPSMDKWPALAPKEAAWEWYRPQGGELTRLRKAGGDMWQHVRMGGLMLRAHRRRPA